MIMDSLGTAQTTCFEPMPVNIAHPIDSDGTSNFVYCERDTVGSGSRCSSAANELTEFTSRDDPCHWRHSLNVPVLELGSS